MLWLELNRGEWGDLLSVPQVDVLPDSVLVRIRLDGLGRLDTDDEQTITSELEQAGFASVEISYV